MMNPRHRDARSVDASRGADLRKSLNRQPHQPTFPVIDADSRETGAKRIVFDGRQRAIGIHVNEPGGKNYSKIQPIFRKSSSHCQFPLLQGAENAQFSSRLVQSGRPLFAFNVHLSLPEFMMAGPISMPYATCHAV